MKRRKALLALLMGLFMALIFAGNSQAKEDWYTCTVGLVGSSGSKHVRVKLTDTGGKFSNKWFECREGREKEMLAVLLCAAASSMNVKVYTDPSDAGKPVIWNVYLLP